MRAYNIVELVDYVVARYDQVYAGRLLRFAYLNDNKRLNSMKAVWAKGDSIVQGGGVKGSLPTPLVQSQSFNGQFYQVDTGIGCCECPIGYRGAFCKHLAAVSTHFNVFFKGVLRFDTDARFNLALLASGTNAGHKRSDFASLNPTINVPANISMAQADALLPLNGEDVLEDNLDLDMLGLNLDATGPGPLNIPIGIAEEEEINDILLSIHRLHKKWAKKSVSNHGLDAVKNVLQHQVTQLNKMSSCNQYMTFMQMQHGAMQSTRKKKIGVNNSAVQRRKGSSGSRQPMKKGAPRKKQQHRVIGGNAVQAPKAPAQPVPGLKHPIPLSPAKVSTRQSSTKRQKSATAKSSMG